MSVSIVRLLQRGCRVAPFLLRSGSMVRFSGGFVVFGCFRMNRFCHGSSPGYPPHSLRPIKHGIIISHCNGRDWLMILISLRRKLTLNYIIIMVSWFRTTADQLICDENLPKDNLRARPAPLLSPPIQSFRRPGRFGSPKCRQRSACIRKSRYTAAERARAMILAFWLGKCAIATR